MGRKKKEEKVPLVVPEEKQAELNMELPAGAPVGVPEKPVRKKRERKKEANVAQAAVTVPARPPVEISETFVLVIQREAEVWARECGLVGELNVATPAKMDYPKYGYGFSVNVREKNDKQRMATARFTSEGKRSYWSMDGKVVI